MNSTKKSLAKNVTVWIVTSVAIIAIITLIASLYISDRHHKNSEQMSEQLQQLVEIQTLNNSLNRLVTNYRGYLAFGRQEFYDLSLKEKLNFDQALTKYAHNQLLQGRNEYIIQNNSQSIEIITKLWTQYANLIDKAFELKQQDAEQLADELSKSQTTPIINEIFEEFNIMQERQKNNVSVILEENRSFDQLLLYLLFGFSFGLALLGFFLVQFMKRSVIYPINRIERHVQLISQGEYVGIPISGRLDEIGKLEIGISEMSSQLQLRLEAIEVSRLEATEQRDELEAQNEEIIAQQEEQAYTLHTLKQRELELELINSFQEKLTGHNGLEGFLSLTLGRMLEILQQDAILVITKTKNTSGNYQVLYSEGYPNRNSMVKEVDDLFGSAIRAIEKGEVYVHPRLLTGSEQGLHRAYQHAVDQYYPLFDEQRKVIGLLLLTRYGTNVISENDQLKARGLIQQFSLALNVQMTSQQRKVQRDLIRQIIESVSEGMLMCDHDGRIILANGRLCDMFEMDIHEGMYTDELIMQLQARTDLTHFTSIIKDIRDGIASQELDNHIRFTYTSKNEEKLYYDVYLRIISNHHDISDGYLFVFRDRSQEEKVDELKNEFISIVSHELRTPLSSILGFVEILLQREITPDKQQKYLETVFKEATRLSNLIIDFLDIQRIEAGKQLYSFDPVQLNTLINELADRYNNSSTHRIDIKWKDDPEQFIVSGDYDRLIQAFDNLLSNAVKYSPGKDHIDLTLRLAGPTIHAEIKDYGLGIPESSRSKLFEKFYRVDNSDRRKIGGTGLGLVIVKEIVEAHQGEVSYESVLGEGSTFTVTLNRLSNGSDLR